MEELNLYLVLPSEFSAQACLKSAPSPKFERGWVKLMGQAMDVGRHFRRYFGQFRPALVGLEMKDQACMLEFARGQSEGAPSVDSNRRVTPAQFGPAPPPVR